MAYDPAQPQPRQDPDDDLLNDELQRALGGAPPTPKPTVSSPAAPKPVQAPVAAPPPPSPTAPPSNAPAPVTPLSGQMQTMGANKDPYPYNGTDKQKADWHKRNPGTGGGTTTTPTPPPGTPLPDGTTPDVVNQPGGPGTNPNNPPAPPGPPPLTKEQYDKLTVQQRKDYFDGKINADGTPKTATPPPGTGTSGDYQGFGQAWLASGGRTPADLAAFVKAHPEYGAVIFGSKGDKIRIGGRAYDAVLSAGAGGKGGSWNYLNPNASSGSAGGGGGTSGGTGGGMYGGQDDAINEAIMRLLARGEQPLDANDPTLQAQFLPTRNVMERGAQLTRGAAAERMAAEGTLVAGGGGAFSGEVNSINENLAGREGQLMADLVTSELQSRRQDVVHALTFAQGSQQLELQRMLSALDRALRAATLEYDMSRPPGV